MEGAEERLALTHNLIPVDCLESLPCGPSVRRRQRLLMKEKTRHFDEDNELAFLEIGTGRILISAVLGITLSVADARLSR